jgi:hypothetical protein
MADRPGSRKHFDRLPLFEIALVLVPHDHIARFIVNANHSIVCGAHAPKSCATSCRLR